MMPVKVIIKWNGIGSTEKALCASSHERCPLPQRKVKKSVNIFFVDSNACAVIAINIIIEAIPTIILAHIHTSYNANQNAYDKRSDRLRYLLAYMPFGFAYQTGILAFSSSVVTLVCRR